METNEIKMIKIAINAVEHVRAKTEWLHENSEELVADELDLIANQLISVSETLKVLIAKEKGE